MICPKCKSQYDIYNAAKCPITDTYICPICLVGLTEADADPSWKQEKEFFPPMFETSDEAKP